MSGTPARRDQSVRGPGARVYASKRSVVSVAATFVIVSLSVAPDPPTTTGDSDASSIVTRLPRSRIASSLARRTTHEGSFATASSEPVLAQPLPLGPDGAARDEGGDALAAGSALEPALSSQAASAPAARSKEARVERASRRRAGVIENDAVAHLCAKIERP
jgi:hypothetical protein